MGTVQILGDSDNDGGEYSVTVAWNSTEKEMATHCSILAWRIPWTEEPGGLQSMGSQELDMTWRPKHHRHRLHSKQYSVERMGQMHGDCRVPEESFSEVSSVSREVASFSVIL